MKKLLLLTFMMFLFASLAIAQATFAPTVMKITCPLEIGYDFGSEPLLITFSVANLPGAFWLVINTHGKADTITDIKNGYLGWHYVNHIDTTVYVSGRYEKETGDQTISWDGTNSDNNKVVADTYSYKIFGYDDRSPLQVVSRYIWLSNGWDVDQNYYVQYGEDGLALEKPYILGNHVWYMSQKEPLDVWKRYGTAYKWKIGDNPEDIGNLATTYMPFYAVQAEGRFMYNTGSPVIEHQDQDYFYHPCRNQVAHNVTLFKWKFMAGGDAELQDDFMGWENDVEWDSWPVMTYEVPTLTTNIDGSEPYLYTCAEVWHIMNDQWTPFRCINKEEGDTVWDISMDEYFLPSDNAGIGEFNMTPNNSFTRGGNLILYTSWPGCLQEMIDTTVLFDDKYSEDYIRWQNWNGDIFIDKNWRPDSATPWACVNMSGNGAANTGMMDSNYFSLYSRTGSTNGNVSCTVLTQDGTGIADLSYFGLDAGTRGKVGSFVHYGSQYDGMYTPAPPTTTENPTSDNQLFFLSFDSGGGTIVFGEVGVEEEVAEAYVLEQNAPNPFNPTTTIGFTLANAGDVTIDVFNIAGQKVDTLVNNFMEAGSHSVVWDASGFSAGVYFYTVKSGNFTKTLKMTLLK